MKILPSVLIALFTTFGGNEAWASEKIEFSYWRCVSEEISIEDADLILVVEIIDIQRITDPIFHHFDFGVAAKVVERKKGNYEKPIIGIHVPRQIPLEPYDPPKYGFEKGKKTTIKGKIDDEGKITIHDPRIRRR